MVISDWGCGACEHRAPLTAFYWQKDPDDNFWDYICPVCGTEDNADLKIPRLDLNGTPFYVPSPKQVAMHICGSKNLLWGGRAGTGKSWAIRHDAYMRCLSMPGYRVLILRRNFTELRDTHLDKAAFEIPRLTGKAASWRASEYTGVFPNGSRVRFGHCENDDAVKQYLSSEFHVIYVDEGATFTQYAVSFISSRLRTKKKKNLKTLLRIGSNPGAMWLYDYYIAKHVDPEVDPSYNPDDYEFIPAETADNPHIDQDDYEQRLNALPSEALRKMYRDGDWLAVEGQFFSEWSPWKLVNDVRREWHVITELPEYNGVPIDKVEWMRTIAVIDWGYDPEPGALVFYTVLPSGRIVAIKERTFRKMVVPKVAAMAVEECEGLKVVQRIGGHDMWMSDKQVGESMSETFARAGFSMHPADTDRENGWQRLHTLLTTTVFEGDVEYPMLQIYAGCSSLVKTIPMLQCDPKHLGDVLQKDDHWADTARWMAMSRVGASKVKAKSSWDRFDPEVRKALMGRRSELKLGTESVQRRSLNG